MARARNVEDCATFDEVDELLRYVPPTGVFYWKVSLSNRALAGSEAGCLDKSSGYIKIKIHGKLYLAHRVAHLLMTGHWPDRDPDHKNRIRHDNSWENVKELAPNRHASMGNQSPQGGRTSGFKGVIWYKRDEKWRAEIKIHGTFVYLRHFADESLAALTYDLLQN